MSIKANINTDANGNILIHMEGGLDYETSTPLRDELTEITSANPRAVITLDLHHVDFVGSSGIGKFVETINLLNTGQFRFINVKPEFMRVFKLYHLAHFEILIDEFESDETESMGTFAARRRTFEN